MSATGPPGTNISLPVAPPWLQLTATSPGNGVRAKLEVTGDAPTFGTFKVDVWAGDGYNRAVRTVTVAFGFQKGVTFPDSPLYERSTFTWTPAVASSRPARSSTWPRSTANRPRASSPPTAEPATRSVAVRERTPFEFVGIAAGGLGEREGERVSQVVGPQRADVPVWAAVFGVVPAADLLADQVDRPRREPAVRTPRADRGGGHERCRRCPAGVGGALVVQVVGQGGAAVAAQEHGAAGATLTANAADLRLLRRAQRLGSVRCDLSRSRLTSDRRTFPEGIRQAPRYCRAEPVAVRSRAVRRARI
jgi:hypothetical protein